MIVLSTFIEFQVIILSLLGLYNFSKTSFKDVDNRLILLPWQEVRGRVLQLKIDDEYLTLLLSCEKIIEVKIHSEVIAEKVNVKELKDSFVSILKSDTKYHIIIEDEPHSTQSMTKKCSISSLHSKPQRTNHNSCYSSYDSLGGDVTEKAE